MLFNNGIGGLYGVGGLAGGLVNRLTGQMQSQNNGSWSNPVLPGAMPFRGNINVAPEGGGQAGFGLNPGAQTTGFDLRQGYMQGQQDTPLPVQPEQNIQGGPVTKPVLNRPFGGGGVFGKLANLASRFSDGNRYNTMPIGGGPQQIQPEYSPALQTPQGVQSGGGRDFVSNRFGQGARNSVADVMRAQAGDQSQTGLHYSRDDLIRSQMRNDPRIGRQYDRTDLDAYAPPPAVWNPGSNSSWLGNRLGGAASLATGLPGGVLNAGGNLLGGAARAGGNLVSGLANAGGNAVSNVFRSFGF